MFKKILGLLLTLSLAVTLIGMGLSAALTNTGSVSQTITVKGVAITVSSTTPGATVDPTTGAVTCPALNIDATNKPTGTDSVGCSFTIAVAVGLPANVNLTFVSSVAGGAKFSEAVAGGAIPDNTSLPLLTSPTVLANMTNAYMPVTIDSHVSWSGLDGSDIGRSLTVTFAITAS